MRQQITIDDAKQKFQSWRATKRAGEKIPSELWSVVQNILDNPKYNRSTVTKGLSISTEQLRTQSPQYYSQDKQLVSEKIFVQASLTKLIPESSLPVTSIIIKNNTGLGMKIISPTGEQFSTLLKLFTG